MKKLLLMALFISLMPITAYADAYYISPDGEADWVNCEHNAGIPGPKSGTDACNLLTANRNVAPGDTVFFREGIYYPTDRRDCIHPGQSGTAENRIVYMPYNDEEVIVDGTHSDREAILFSPGWRTGDRNDGRSYITVMGIHFSNWNKLGDLYYASYNEIADCVFSGHKDDGMNASYNGFYLSYESSHNWIHGNTWHTFGHFVGKDQGCIINIGHDNTGNAENSGNDFNTVENNHFYASGHHVVGVNNAKYNVIRNNYIHNEGWSTTGACSEWPTGVCGYRVMSMTDNSGLDVAGSNLLEENNIAYGAQYGGPHLVSGASGSGLTIHTDSNIVRYNNFFGNVMFGIRIGSSISGSTGIGNRIYNNTFYYNGYNMDSWGVINEDDEKLHAWGDILRMSFLIYHNSCDGTVEDNIIKNNLAHESWSETNNLSGSSYYPAFYGRGAAECNTITHNWGHTGAPQREPFEPYPDPMFADPDISDPMALVFSDGKWSGKPDLSLQASSPVIDKGIHLTHAVNSGSNSTILKVEDATYFQDGTWGSDLARKSLYADWIAVGDVSNAVEISSIDYIGNIITLSSPITWEDGGYIWLYKKSDGERVLYGDAPDFGAHEFVSSTGVEGDDNIPEYFSLKQNYPNPFNPITTIRYALAERGNVSLIVYDVLGREVVVLVNENKPAGMHSTRWDGRNQRGARVVSGIYFYQLKSDGGYIETKKMIFVK